MASPTLQQLDVFWAQLSTGGMTAMLGHSPDGIVTDDDDDDFDGDLNRKIMKVEHAGACIGCNACARVCPKNCQTHVPADQLAA